MSIASTKNMHAIKRFALRIASALLTVFLVLCFQGAPFQDAFAAESKATSKSSKEESKSLVSPDKKKEMTKDEEKDEEPEEEEEDEETEEEKARREAAEQLHASADALYAQASATKSSLNVAEAKYEEATAALEEANEQLDIAKVEYEEKSAEIVELTEELSDYVVDMYKQGGATPYLDVMLGATSYREFITSWNMTVTVTGYGKSIVTEKKALREEAVNKLTTCEGQVKESEKAKALAESNRHQLNATHLAYLANAAELRAEAAKLEDDEDAANEAEEEAAAARAALDEAIKQGLAGDSFLSGTGYFNHPCPNSTVSSLFGYRSFDNSHHKGLDLAAPEGTPYYAADSGTVTAATNGGGDNGGAGNWIVIDHGNGLVTKYMHSLVTFVSPGDRVVKGQNIGLVGSTGNSTGPHLHFQVELNGVAVNPSSYL